MKKLNLKNKTFAQFKLEMDGSDVRALRFSLGLNQNQFAKLVGITQVTISKYEASDKPISPRGAMLIHSIVMGLKMMNYVNDNLDDHQEGEVDDE